MFCVACPITFTVILGLIPASSTKANFSAGTNIKTFVVRSWRGLGIFWSN